MAWIVNQKARERKRESRASPDRSVASEAHAQVKEEERGPRRAGSASSAPALGAKALSVKIELVVVAVPSLAKSAVFPAGLVVVSGLTSFTFEVRLMLQNLSFTGREVHTFYLEFFLRLR